MAFFVLLAKFGISFAFNITYMQTPLLFPTRLRGTAYGLCNVVARFVTIIAPLLAEEPEPIPMLFYSGSAILGAFASLFLKTNVHYD